MSFIFNWSTELFIICPNRMISSYFHLHFHILKFFFKWNLKLVSPCYCFKLFGSNSQGHIPVFQQVPMSSNCFFWRDIDYHYFWDSPFSIIISVLITSASPLPFFTYLLTLFYMFKFWLLTRKQRKAKDGWEIERGIIGKNQKCN